MANLTPNMNLPYSVIGVDSGLTWEQNLNAALGINGGGIDGHNHSSGNGVQIGVSGLNLDGDLTFNGNSATFVKSLVFNQQASLATANSLFVGNDGNLYFNDGANDPSIPITLNGAVNATSDGISSGTATASFSSGVLVVNSASNTPANIQGGSLLLGNNVAASKFLTLEPPSAMGDNYSLVLPSVPGATMAMTLDSSGNMGTGSFSGAQLTSGSVALATIATQSVDQTKIVVRSQGATVGVGGFANEAAATSVVNSGGSATVVQSVNITTNGNPVFVGLKPGSSTSSIQVSSSTAIQTISGTIFILRDSTTIATIQIGHTVNTPGSNSSLLVPPGSAYAWDIPSAGNYTYSVQIQASTSFTSITLNNVTLWAYEIK